MLSFTSHALYTLIILSFASLAFCKLLHCTCVVIKCSFLIDFSGFVSKNFHGFHSITELECSGSSLPTDADILTIVIYVVRNDHVIASANVGKEECSTSGSFSSCVFHPQDTRGAQLRTLITDPPTEEEYRVYGCNVTSFKTGGRLNTVTWMTRVERERKSCVVHVYVCIDIVIGHCIGTTDTLGEGGWRGDNTWMNCVILTWKVILTKRLG